MVSVVGGRELASAEHSATADAFRAALHAHAILYIHPARQCSWWARLSFVVMPRTTYAMRPSYSACVPIQNHTIPSGFSTPSAR